MDELDDAARGWVGLPKFDRDYLGQRVKGTLIRARRRYLVETFGEQMLGAVAQAAPPDAARILTDVPLAFEWGPMQRMIGLDIAIIRVAFSGDAARMQHLGAEIAGYDLPLTYRALMKAGSPSFVARRMGSVYQRYFREGNVRAVASDKGATMRFGGASQPLFMCRYGMAGWMQRAIRLSGGRNCQIEHTECRHDGHAECIWRCDWE